LQKIGRVRFDQGRMAEAESAFAAAQTTAGELVRRIPESADYAALEADTQTWLGRVLWARGDLDGALTRFRSALARLAALTPAQQDATAILDLGASLHTNIGRVLEAKGDLDTARADYVVVLATYERLSARERDRLDWKSEVGYAHNNLGQIAWKEGHLDEAIREYAADRRMKASLAVLEPGSNSRREDLLISNAILGKNLAAVGETEMAERYLRAAVDESLRLLQLDASVTSWQEDAGYYSMMLSALARTRGNLADANRFGDIALSRLRSLTGQDPQNVQWARNLAEGEMEAARRLLAAHRADAAGAMIGAAQARFRDVVKEDAADRANAQVLARMDIVAGDVAQAKGDAEGARRAWLAADAATRELGNASRDPAWLDARASALLRLGDIDAARPLLEQLAAMGYRHADLLASANARDLSLEPDAEAGRRISAAVATLADAGRADASAPGHTNGDL
jgi:tetratricopeptide (TPR) repeat protein